MFNPRPRRIEKKLLFLYPFEVLPPYTGVVPLGAVASRCGIISSEVESSRENESAPKIQTLLTVSEDGLCFSQSKFANDNEVLRFAKDS